METSTRLRAISNEDCEARELSPDIYIEEEMVEESFSKRSSNPLSMTKDNDITKLKREIGALIQVVKGLLKTKHDMRSEIIELNKRVNKCETDIKTQRSTTVTRVYQYLQNEYEIIKEHSDHRPLSNIVKRTAGATGLSEQTVTDLLEEEQDKNRSSRSDSQNYRSKLLDNGFESSSSGVSDDCPLANVNVDISTVKTEPVDEDCTNPLAIPQDSLPAELQAMLDTANDSVDHSVQRNGRYRQRKTQPQLSTKTSENTDLQPILQNQAVLFNITNSILDSQKQIMRKLASMSVRMEECLTNKISTTSDDIVENPIGITQIKCAEDIQRMEELLADVEYKRKLMKSCSVICSASEGKGVTFAYRFLDILFTREFLCNCSWSGGSRSDEVKIGFKSYKNTINFFFEMINHWDPLYTHEANENFLRVVLRNAFKRSLAKNERSSTLRHRRSKYPKKSHD